MNESRSTLPARNMQALLDSATNALQMGARQYFTPPESARFLLGSRFLPARRLLAADLFGVGCGSLLDAVGAEHTFGVDIDPRAKDDSAVRRTEIDKRAVADITELYPYLFRAAVSFPLLVSNPPFSLHWHSERIIPTLRESRCLQVADYAKAHASDIIDSTLATFLMMLDRLSFGGGEGVLIANHATVERLILADPGLASKCWLVVKLDNGVVAPDCAKFTACALYFSADHLGTAPHEIDLTSIERADALEHSPVVQALPKSLASYHRRGCGSDTFYGSAPVILNHAETCAAELRRDQNPGTRRAWNLSLGADGKIETHLTPFQHLDMTLDREQVRLLHGLKGQHPAALVVQNHRRKELLSCVTSPIWRVEPALADAVNAAVNAYHRERAPLYPLPAVQRLGYVDEWEKIACALDGIDGFRKGKAYAISTFSESTKYRTKVANSEGGKDDVTRTGQELVVGIYDDKHRMHTFHYRHEGRDYDDDVDFADNPLAHGILDIAKHFEIPAVPDIVDANPAGHAAALRKLDDLELEISARTGEPFAFQFHQKDHLSRAALVNGLGIVWEQGLGKTIAMFAMPRVWSPAPQCVLIVSPGAIIPQTIREGEEKFGVAVKHITGPADIAADPFLHRRLVAGKDAATLPDDGLGTRYYICTYTALGMNGADERSPKRVGKGRNQRIDWPEPTLRQRRNWMKDEGLDAVEWTHTDTDESFHGFNASGIGDSRTYNFPTPPPPPTPTPTRPLSIAAPATSLADAATSPGEAAPSSPSSCPQSSCQITCLAWPSLSTIVRDVFDCVIIDEAVRIKNGATHQSLGVRKLDPKYRLVLTGTPIKNNLIDAFYLAHWACGGGLQPTTRWPYAGTPEAQVAFAEGHLIREENHSAARRHHDRTGDWRAFKKRTNEICNIHRLWKLFGPVFLRKRKADIAANLVPKHIVPMRVKMGTAQRQVYGFHVRNKPEFSKEGIELNALGAMGTQIALLRLAALAPDSPGLEGFHTNRNPEHYHPRSDWAWTPKLGATLALIADILERGEQVVVGSTYQYFSKTLHERLRQAGVSSILLDGNTGEKARGLRAGEFKAKRHAVLIAGAKSMGEGHSFDQCPNLIMPCLDWAFDVNAQLAERVHRLTSRKDVRIYTMVTEGTIDERLAQVFAEKADSAGLALDGQISQTATEEINLAELLNQSVKDYNPDAPTVDESLMAEEWKAHLKARLTNAEIRFRSTVAPMPAAGGKAIVGQAPRLPGVGSAVPSSPLKTENSPPILRPDLDLLTLLDLPAHQPHATPAEAAYADETALAEALNPTPKVRWTSLSFADLLATLREEAALCA